MASLKTKSGAKNRVKDTGSRHRDTADPGSKKGVGQTGKSAPALSVFSLLEIESPSTPVSEFDYISIGQTGIKKTGIDNLAQQIGLSRKRMAEEIFDVSVKTLERKNPGEKLDKKISSHAVEIAKILQHASQVFEEDEKVKHWFNAKNEALNNQPPIAYIDTLTGLGLVHDILTRIEEGVYS